MILTITPNINVWSPIHSLAEIKSHVPQAGFLTQNLLQFQIDVVPTILHIHTYMYNKPAVPA